MLELAWWRWHSGSRQRHNNQLVFHALAARVFVRRLGDAAVAFEASNWQTHVLPPAARVICDLVDECGGPGRATEADVVALIRSTLGFEPNSPEIEPLLKQLGLAA